MYNKYLYCKDIMKNIKKTQTRQIIFNTYVLLIFEYTEGRRASVSYWKNSEVQVTIEALVPLMNVPNY